jgi:hypothetical protein
MLYISIDGPGGALGLKKYKAQRLKLKVKIYHDFIAQYGICAPSRP